MKAKLTTVKYIFLMSSLLFLFIVLQSIVVVYTPHTFVRIMNMIAIIVASGIVGAFNREMFILKRNSNNLAFIKHRVERKLLECKKIS
ncbi:MULTISPECIES: hypothetical protein [unclassified Sutcliffiella]|uniref:hypothetical protein n=1 Tax=unclassified Sutcliffiella TaxID=2837532 RepID=UPI0030CF4D73